MYYEKQTKQKRPKKKKKKEKKTKKKTKNNNKEKTNSPKVTRWLGRIKGDLGFMIDGEQKE